jgi:hypothetical protein
MKIERQKRHGIALSNAGWLILGKKLIPAVILLQ